MCSLERVKIFIHTKEMAYGKKLARFIADQHNSCMDVELMTEIKDKTKFQKSDYVVSDDRECLERLECNTVQIVKNPDVQEEREIFMYQSRDGIYRKLLRMTGAENRYEEKNISKNEAEIICVFSPEGGDEKTSLALHTALKMSDSGKVLYASLCGFPVFLGREISDTAKVEKPGLSELVLCAGNRIFDEKLEGMVFQAGRISMLAPVEHYRDLLDYSLEDITQFVEGMKKQKMFDVVVLEMGQLFEYTLDLLVCADQVLVPKEPGFFAAVKRHVLQQYCAMEGKEELWDRIRFEPVSFHIPEDAGEVNRILSGESGGDFP